jgi:tetratricopeptide (TPR) repeat protein
MPPMTPELWQEFHSDQVERQAWQKAKSDPVAADKLDEQALQLWPDNDNALTGLGDCKERITGNPKVAIPYYRKAFFDNATGRIKYPGFPNDLLTAALLFERAGEKADAVRLYNCAANDLNRVLKRRAANYKIGTAKGNIPMPYTPVLLPEMSDESAPLDLACYTHVGLGLAEQGGRDEQARADFESAVSIKDTPIARYYLAKHKKDSPGYYRDQKPATAVQPSK